MSNRSTQLGEDEPIGIVFRNKAQPQPNFLTQELPPEPSLQDWIQTIWSFGWDLPEPETITVSVVPNNCASAIFQIQTDSPWSGSKLVGPRKSIYRYELQGSGLMIGVRFEPGGLFDLTRKTSSQLVDSVANIDLLLGVSASEINRTVLSASSFFEQVAILNHALKSVAPPKCSADYKIVKDIYQFILANESVLKVGDLLDFAETSERTIQRLFEKYIGFSPKHVIRVARFQAALKAMRGGVSIPWTDFAASLGYFDQSHFINDFRSITGVTPSDFAKQQNV